MFPEKDHQEKILIACSKMREGEKGRLREGGKKKTAERKCFVLEIFSFFLAISVKVESTTRKSACMLKMSSYQLCFLV